MITQLFISLRAFVALTILTCGLYPLAVTAIAQLAFPRQANGSLVSVGEKSVGSVLLAQKFTSPRYFWPRPSAGDYNTVASGASNQGFTSKKLLDAVTERRVIWGQNAPSDLLYASGSGLDPHISPEAAAWQVSRIVTERQISPEHVQTLITQLTELPQFGFLGQPRVNVLLLNVALDGLK